MRFWRHTLDHTLQRLEHERAVPTVLWPNGRWAPDPSVDLVTYGMPLDEVDAQAFADAHCGGRVDLYAAALTGEEYAAEMSRMREQLGVQG